MLPGSRCSVSQDKAAPGGAPVLPSLPAHSPCPQTGDGVLGMGDAGDAGCAIPHLRFPAGCRAGGVGVSRRGRIFPSALANPDRGSNPALEAPGMLLPGMLFQGR